MRQALKGIGVIYRRDMVATLAHAGTYIYMAAFVLTSSAAAFWGAGFLQNDQASLEPFFRYQPWILLAFTPLLSLRLWSEDYRSGTIELLLSQPTGLAGLVLGRILAMWSIILIAYGFTLPLWVSLNYLGTPDNAAILTGYFGLLALSFVFCALSSFTSSLTQIPVAGFMLAVFIGTVLLTLGSDIPILPGGLSGDMLRAQSLAGPVRALMSGLIGLADVFYMVGLAVFFTVLCVWVLYRRKRPGQQYQPVFLSGCAALIMAFVGINLLARSIMGGVAFDATGRALYAVSPGTQNIISSLEEPVSLSFYFSSAAAEDYPDIYLYGERVRKMLSALERAGNGRVQVREINPEAWTAEEDDALRAGLESVPTRSGTPLYFGISGYNALNAQAVIPLLSPAREPQLEYDLARILSQLRGDGPAKIGWVDSSGPLSFSVFKEALERAYNVQSIGGAEALTNSDINIVVVPNAHDVSAADSHRLKAWAEGGGQIITFADTHMLALSEGDPAADPGPLAETPPAFLLRSFGLRISSDVAAVNADGSNIIRLSAAHVNESAMTRNALAQGLHMNIAAVLDVPDIAVSMTEDVSVVEYQEIQEQALSAPQTLPMISNIDDQLLVFADRDMVADPQDGFYGILEADNLAFIMNIIAEKSSDPDLDAVPQRQGNTRPLSRLNQMQNRLRTNYETSSRELDRALQAETLNLQSLTNTGAPSRAIVNSKSALSDLRRRRRNVEQTYQDSLRTVEETLVWINIWLPPLIILILGLIINLLIRMRPRAWP